jgi:predicted MPP superfamily phosphohydrolase
MLVDLMDSVYRIVYLSDTHITKYGQFVEKKFDEVVKKISGLEPPPNVMVHTGDLTDNGVLQTMNLQLKN